MSLETNVKK